MKMTDLEHQNKKFNWKVVLPSLAVIIIVYFIASYAIEQYKLPERTVVYCQFNTTIDDAMPRDQCAYVKIISRDINDVDIHKFEKFGRCSESLDNLPTCEGDTYHYSKYRLKDICDGENCDNVDGVACNAFYIVYHDVNDTDREEFEQNYFVKANLESEELLMEEFNKCNVKIEWP